MKRLIFATGNQNKMREIREILADLPVEILSMKEAGIEADIVEDGKTFEENAIIKAKTIMELTGVLQNHLHSCHNGLRPYHLQTAFRHSVLR